MPASISRKRRRAGLRRLGLLPRRGAVSPGSSRAAEAAPSFEWEQRTAARYGGRWRSLPEIVQFWHRRGRGGKPAGTAVPRPEAILLIESGGAVLKEGRWWYSTIPGWALYSTTSEDRASVRGSRLRWTGPVAKEQFVSKIRHQREWRGVTQAELAAGLAASQSWISLVESGKLRLGRSREREVMEAISRVAERKSKLRNSVRRLFASSTDVGV